MEPAMLIYTVFTAVYYISLAVSLITKQRSEQVVFDYILYYFKIYTCVAALYLIHVKSAIKQEYKAIFISAIVSLLFSTLNFDLDISYSTLKSKMNLLEKK